KARRLFLHAGLVLLQSPGRVHAYGAADGALRWEAPSSDTIVPSP
ncbi:MAG: PQQ-binding-like beta-propeller repeat protein, partial [Labilithrix sp.]|nr:PQQ-binding-like beta-propeller repeat protein [Labilithrix sp.]